MRRERGLSSAAVASLTERTEGSYILYTGLGRMGRTVLPPWLEFTTRP